MKKETPMMAQYRAIRSSLPDEVILFFRLGDFYEMFFEDAIQAASILDITLTKRHEVPMCGVPYHASAAYLEKLIKAGRKVAICEQTEESTQSKGVVKREIKQIITPGTILDEMQLSQAQHHFIASLWSDEKGRWGWAQLDLSTGEFWVEEIGTEEEIYAHIVRYQPQEILIAESQHERISLPESVRNQTTQLDAWIFHHDQATDSVKKQFKVLSLDGLGLMDAPLGVGAAGALIFYLKQRLHRDLSHIHSISVRKTEDYLILDETTITNLELVKVMHSHAATQQTTLLATLDSTQTPMGGRLLREWMLRPLNRRDQIIERQESVAYLHESHVRLTTLRDLLKPIGDMHRIISRITTSRATNPRDMLALKHILMQLPDLKATRDAAHENLLNTLLAEIEPLPDLLSEIDQAVADESPTHLRDGGVIKEGYDTELDELRHLSLHGKEWLANFQAEEAVKHDIKNLKIRYNRVFGYYIEVSKAQLDRVPSHYIRKQTLAQAERYVVPELTEKAEQIQSAEDKAILRETHLFEQLQYKVDALSQAILRNASLLAQIDVLSALAERALTLHYTQPEIIDEDSLTIDQGRHPVIEQLLVADRFVANDCTLDIDEQQLIMLTGPNMAGKSTYIRQVALLVLMAHMGSFIPADHARIGVRDRIFTRVGASDDLARGRSTFMVEMQETAQILHAATSKSLVILDEIGRGTSTYDGVSIAWSVAEYLTNRKEKPLTLFATHYHELARLADAHAGVKNYCVKVKEHGNEITFLRIIAPGATDKSYGIQVARLAGVPTAVIQRAETILQQLENPVDEVPASKKSHKKSSILPDSTKNQLDLW
jgi:DNA mismatch repair protein MutS